MGQTSNYGLSQPACWEQPSRSDWCGDMAAIDAALAEKAEVVVGSYTGNNADSRTISLGFTPSAVLVEDMSGARSASPCGGLAVTGGPLRAYYSSGNVVTITADGFLCQSGGGSDGSVNNANSQYRYLALR